MSQMNFSKVPPSQAQQASQASSTSDHTTLQSLTREQQQTFFQRSLIQNKTIFTTPHGTFSKLDEPVLSSWHLTIPQSSDAFAHEAARTFYALNRFAIHVNTCPHFVTWSLANYKPSDFCDYTRRTLRLAGGAWRVLRRADGNCLDAVITERATCLPRSGVQRNGSRVLASC